MTTTRSLKAFEFVWAGIFVALAGATLALGTPGWSETIAISLAATAILVVVEMRKPAYHGLGWQRINPGLLGWWRARRAEECG